MELQTMSEEIRNSMASTAWVQMQSFGVCPGSGRGIENDGEDLHFKSALPTYVYAFP